MTIRLSAAALAVASACPLAAHAAGATSAPIVLAAAPAEQPTVVITATRQSQRSDELLASVDQLDREEIERAGPGTVLDLLARQPGVQVSSNGGPGKTRPSTCAAPTATTRSC